MKKLIWRPDGDRAADPTAVGGKAANLARLNRIGQRVPAFFVVTTAAMHAGRARGGGAADVRKEIERAHRDLFGESHPPYVAVRSSAIGEDAAGDSFAGIHDSFLYVKGAHAVWEAVQRVWESAFADRALSYRASRNLPTDAIEIAVVVQRMIDARVSGVVFTAEPTTGDVHRVVISSVFGLGAVFVSGGVEAVLFTIDKPSGYIDQTIASNHVRFMVDVLQVQCM